MPLQLDKVHVHEKQPGGAMVLIRTNAYIRFVKQEEAPCIIQNGVWYSDGGPKIKLADVPQWVWAQAKKMTEEGKRKVGLVLPSDPGFKESEPEIESPGAVQNLTDPSEKIEESTEELPPDLIETIYALRADDDAHWTKSGLPSLNILKERMGHYVSRGDVDAHAPNYNRKIAAANIVKE